MSNVTITQINPRDGHTITRTWDFDMPSTDWCCPVCGSNKVHLMSHGDGILCHRTVECGFAPFIGGPGRTKPAIKVHGHDCGKEGV